MVVPVFQIGEEPGPRVFIAIGIIPNVCTLGNPYKILVSLDRSIIMVALERYHLIFIRHPEAGLLGHADPAAGLVPPISASQVLISAYQFLFIFSFYFMTPPANYSGSAIIMDTSDIFAVLRIFAVKGFGIKGIQGRPPLGLVVVVAHMVIPETFPGKEGNL